MDAEKEYAPEYSRREKLKHIVLWSLIGLIMYLAHRYFGLPFLEAITQRPHCYQILGWDGLGFLWRLLFIGIPLSLMLLLMMLLVPLGFKTLRDGQYPPLGTKVYKPTRIRKGTVARYFGSTLMIIPVFFLLFVWWGSAQIEKMPVLEIDKMDFSQCQSNNP